MSINNKCMLVYGLKEDEIKKIKAKNFKVIEITNDMALMTLEDIVLKVNGENTFSELPLDEKAIIFNGFNDAQLKENIKFIRSFIQGGVLAVTTKESYKWTFQYLLEHLVEEREWFKVQQETKGE